VNADEANDTSRARARDHTRELQRALYRAAKASPKRRFHALYDKVYDLEVLWSAWGAVRANRGAPGIDGETIEGIEHRGVASFLASSGRNCSRGHIGQRQRAGSRFPKPPEGSGRWISSRSGIEWCSMRPI